MARPARTRLQRELEEAVENLPPADGSAKEALAHATSMINIWGLRFRIASADHDVALASGEHSKRAVSEGLMKLASRELCEWEKRRSAAQSDLVNDLLIEEQEHNAKQAEAGRAFAAAKAKRDADR